MTHRVRYAAHDSQAHVSSHLRRKSTSINPRYWVIDRQTNTPVDDASSMYLAKRIAADMNRADRANRSNS